MILIRMRQFAPVAGLALFCAVAGAAPHRGAVEPAESGWKWTAERADRWYQPLPWLVGCNFIPSTAINELEFWQTDTYDPATIDRELGWAEGLGFNIARVFLHNLVWEQDGDAFLNRMDNFLGIAGKHHIRILFVLFDDCWNADPHLGKQPEPIPGVHNSGWMQSPGYQRVDDPSTWGPLENYEKAVLKRFGDDPRVLFWDLYNEPGNGQPPQQNREKSLAFLHAVFKWARDVEPSQPVSVDVWNAYLPIDRFAWENSDVITAHSYSDRSTTGQMIKDMKLSGRPVIFTEWMARPRNSTFATHLQMFKDEGVGNICWGFVAGKTNTIFPWGSKPGTLEPKVWFHDIFRRDGTPYDPAEVELIRKLTGATGR